MVNYLELPIGERAPEVINAVIEIPLEGINSTITRNSTSSASTGTSTRRSTILATMASFPQPSATTGTLWMCWCW